MLTFDTSGRRGPDAADSRRMLVMGVGGGGTLAVARMRASWQDGPPVLGVNTDVQALDASGIPARIQIGKGITQGLGAGGDPSIGKLAAEDDTDALREAISQAEVLFLVAGLGGGTGTGAAPVVARIAREEGVMTLCFATLPFDFEGERRKRQAEEGLRALRMHADIVVVLPNERLLRMFEPRTNLTEAFGRADEMLGVAIRAMWKLLSQAGIINLDFADLRHLVEHSGGSCVFAYGEGEGPDKVGAAVTNLLNSPQVYQGNLFRESGAVLVSIVGGPDLALVDVQKVMTRITSLGRPDAKVFMGAAVDETWQDKVAVTVLAAEQWSESAPEPGARAAATAPKEPAAETKSEGRPRPPPTEKAVQADLNFEAADKGIRFRNVEPTLYAGEDLDIPTFIRRGVKLSTDR